MMLRFVLLLVLSIIISRMFWRIVGSFREGVAGQSQPGVSPRGVPMVRDPVCGTFVLPERAVTLAHGRARLFFCSDACRDKYRAEHDSRQGRTA
jgi:YHS domain-containing protein